MRIKLKPSFLATLAMLALLFSATQAQEVPPPAPITTGQTEVIVQETITDSNTASRAPRPEKTMLPTLEVLSGRPLSTWTNKPDDGFRYVGFVLSNTTNTFSSGYGNVISGPVRKALMCFSNSTRAENGQAVLRIGTSQGIYFPFAVKLARDGFIVTELGSKVTLTNKLTGEVYEKGSKILYLLPGLNFSSFIEVDFGEELNPIQVLLELGDNKADFALNFLEVNDPRPRPAPPTRPLKP